MLSERQRRAPHTRRTDYRLRTIAITTVVAALVISGASGCTLLGAAMGHEATTSEEDHALESLTARKFREQLPATEAIRFTRKGNVSGAGSWAANAVVTIAGHQYEEILGPSEIGGDRLPEPASLPAVHIMTLHHSDGSSEVLR